jgi:hypothetical protein
MVKRAPLALQYAAGLVKRSSMRLLFAYIGSKRVNLHVDPVCSSTIIPQRFPFQPFYLEASDNCQVCDQSYTEISFDYRRIKLHTLSRNIYLQLYLAGHTHHR